MDEQQETLPAIVGRAIEQVPSMRKQLEINKELEAQNEKIDLLKKAGLTAQIRKLWYMPEFQIRRKQLLNDLWTLKLTHGKIFKELDYSKVLLLVQEHGKKIGKTLCLSTATVEAYPQGIPPKHVLETLQKVRDIGVFDDYKIWYATEVKDPILVGIIFDFMNVKERTFYLDHWGDDIPFDKVGIE